jgi:hypothetical protein
MSAAGWGLIGTLFGGGITVFGNWFMHRAERSERETRAAAEAAARAREERKIAYLRLLTAARRLRYIARPEASRDKDEIDGLRTELSTVQYEIAVVALPEMGMRSDLVRRSTLDYLNEALDEAAPQQSPAVKKLRRAARAAVDEFVEAAHDELYRDAPVSAPLDRART